MATSPGASAPHVPRRAGEAERAPGRRAATLWASAITVVAVVTIGVSYSVSSGGELGPFGVYEPPVWALPAVFASGALSATGAWVTRVRRPAAACGLALAAMAVLLPFWAAWEWLSASARSTLLATSPLAVPGVARAVLGLSPRRATTGGRRHLHAVLLLSSAAVLVRLAGYNPFADPGCVRVCDDIHPLLAGALSPHTALLMAAALTTGAAGAALPAMARAGTAGVPRTAVATGLVAVGMLAAAAVWQAARWGEPAPSLTQQMLEPSAVALVAATVCAAAIRAAATRAAFDRLAHRLSGPDAAVTGVAAGVRHVHFALPAAPGTPDGEPRWVDVRGREVAGTAPGPFVVLADDGLPVLRLLLTRHADGDDVLAGLTPTTRLALGNARLSALLRARLSEIQASQRRVVAACDAERRRLERDLHDGVQQHLVAAALHLKIAASTMTPQQAHTLAGAEAAVHAALAELRRIAHGFFPGVLADEGLDAGLEDLAASCEIPVTVDSQSGVEGGTQAALAGYALVAAALENATREPPALGAEVSAVRDGDTCTVRVAITSADRRDAAGPSLLDAADRVGAAGGEFHVTDTAHNGTLVTVLTAVIPCGP